MLPEELCRGCRFLLLYLIYLKIIFKKSKIIFKRTTFIGSTSSCASLHMDILMQVQHFCCPCLSRAHHWSEHMAHVGAGPKILTPFGTVQSHLRAEAGRSGGHQDMDTAVGVDLCSQRHTNCQVVTWVYPRTPRWKAGALFHGAI